MDFEQKLNPKRNTIIEW